jgi:hypothetical protein
VIVPTIGAGGIVVDGGSMKTGAEVVDVQPAELVTVKKLNVFGVRFPIVVDGVLPATDPGLTIQLPAGRPFNTTLPVGTAAVG